MMNDRDAFTEAAVIAAARTVREDDEVVAASIVLPSRPNYRQLAHFRDCEQGLGVHFSKVPDGGNDIEIERLEPQPQPLPLLTPTPASISMPHTPHWIHELLRSTEGVR